ncbi:selenocysteine-specific elongation factor [Campylobacter pinnipediorum subsp. caledonicus]|uniref:Selenocysteine-specific elongation factor n=1 Tax=Campylobacter pinnipediorum subsp. caledonicus TaxID=1874362 RepID=A0A1S6U9L9_9BACT|nr:selenocysteine-specific translation elongation factor [Campylobacter pinnipediorum]AQW88147.1 selenocysteine-specific elongation factor [Campylobacter pinnipediorum subsp. caledonicus]
MNSLIIGTSGHIDHGKTSLIRALNGFDGDSLEQEKSRGITIDLSFSNLQNNDTNIAFIDVPGHENLVKTMISGAFAFDACMLVIAANDGIMPQTKEHMNVLSLLGVKDVILVVTKIDLVDSDTMHSLENKAKEYIKNSTNLNILKTFYTSIKDSNAIEELKKYLFTLRPKKRDTDGVFRYYIDRIFSIKGIGSVVTGSVISGKVSVGDKLFDYDISKDVSVRSIQLHDKNENVATTSNRAALNLTGVQLSELKKGHILSKKGFFRGFKEVDTIVFADDLKHNQNLTFCVGSKQVATKAVVLSDEKDKFVSFKFEKDMFLIFNEPFVLLLNGRVIGGGRVLNPISEPMKKQGKIALLIALNNLDFKRVFEILKLTHKNGFGLISSTQRFNLTHKQAVDIAKTLPNSFVDEDALNVYDEEVKYRIIEFIKFIIDKNKFAIFSASSISLKLGWASEKLTQSCIDELYNSGIIEKNSGVYTKKGVDFSELKIKLEDEIYKILDNDKFAPKAPYNIYDELEIDRLSGDNALKKLTANGRVIRLAHNLFITSKNLTEVLKYLKNLIKEDGFVNVQNAKNRLNLSRKYIIAYLEKLDLDSDIIKNGQNRVFRSN